jgi:flagellar export protein FliJ
MKVSELRFGTLLKVREHQKKAAQQELSRIRTEKEIAQTKLTTLDQVQQDEMNTSIKKEKAKATDIQTSRAFIRRLSREIEQQQKKVEEITSKEEDKRVEVVERTQEKEMIQQLEEKYQTHLAKERERKEQRMVDILAQRVKSSL